jgi:hypothetical protein
LEKGLTERVVPVSDPAVVIRVEGVVADKRQRRNRMQEERERDAGERDQRSLDDARCARFARDDRLGLGSRSTRQRR